MSRSVIFLSLFVFLPALVLAALAFRAANLDHAERVEELRRSVERVAAGLAEGVGSRMAKAAEEGVANARIVVGYARSNAGHAWGDGASSADTQGKGPSRWEEQPVGRRIAYSPDGGEPREFAAAATADELRYYRLSARGGESYEFGRRDPDRAIDAYAFYLPRIRSPELRAGLKLRAGRAALRAAEAESARSSEPPGPEGDEVHPGDEGTSGDDAGQGDCGRLRSLRALGGEILAELFRSAGGVLTEEGLPVDLLAAAMLLARCEIQPAAEDLRRSAAARLRERAPSLSTSLLAELMATLDPEDAEALELLESRRALEAAVREHPEILDAADAVLDDGYLLLARLVQSPAGPPAAPEGAEVGPQRSVRRIPVDLPALEAGGLKARIEYLHPQEDSRAFAVGASGGGASADSASLGRPGAGGPSGDGAAAAAPAAPRSPDAASPVAFEARCPIRLGKDGPQVATLFLREPSYARTLEDFDRRRTIQRALIGLLVFVTAAGGLALLRFVRRERQLARLRSKLIQNVSHELKTPVTSIRLFAEMLADDPLSEEQGRRFARLLGAETARLGHIFENFLDAARLDGKDTEKLAVEPVDVAALLGQIADAFAVRAAEAKVAFRCVGFGAGQATEVPGSAVETGGISKMISAEPFVIATSGAAVERILLNLLDNALKYRRPAGAEIELRLERSGDGQPGKARAGESVRICVEDNGPGIPRRDQERVFEEFYRVRYDDYGVKGSGLGLTIARRLARKLGGDVTLWSVEGKGSTFTLILPATAGA